MAFAAGFRAGMDLALKREQLDALKAERQARDDFAKLEAESEGRTYTPPDRRNVFEWIADGITDLFSGKNQEKAAPNAPPIVSEQPRTQALPTPNPMEARPYTPPGGAGGDPVTPATATPRAGAIREEALAPPAPRVTAGSGGADPYYGPGGPPPSQGETGANLPYQGKPRSQALPTPAVPESDLQPTGQGGDPAAPPRADALAAVPERFRAKVLEEAKKNGLPPEVLAGVFDVESSWDPRAIRKRDQKEINPKTGEPYPSLGLGQWGENWAAAAGFDPLDPDASIAATAKRMGDYYKKTGKLDAAILQHNRGEQGTANLIGQGGDPAKDPYVGKVRAAAAKYGGTSEGAAPQGDAAASVDPARAKQVLSAATRGDIGVPPKQYDVDVVGGQRRMAETKDHEQYWTKRMNIALKTGNPALISAVREAGAATMIGGITRNGAYAIEAMRNGDAEMAEQYLKKLYSYIPDGMRADIKFDPATKKATITQIDEKTGKVKGTQVMGVDDIERMYIGALDPVKLQGIFKSRADIRQGDRALDLREDYNKEMANYREEQANQRRQTAFDNQKNRESQLALQREKEGNQIEKDILEQLPNWKVVDPRDKTKPARALTDPEKEAAIAVARDAIDQGLGQGTAMTIARDFAAGKIGKAKNAEGKWEWMRNVFDERGNIIGATPMGYVVGPRAERLFATNQGELGVRGQHTARRDKMQRDIRDSMNQGGGDARQTAMPPGEPARRAPPGGLTPAPGQFNYGAPRRTAMPDEFNGVY